MRPALILIIIAALALPPQVSGAPPDQAPEIIGVSIRLDQPLQEALVTEQSPGIVTFTGQVAVDKPPALRAVVTLESSVDTGWVCSISPSTAVFTSTTPQSFTATAVVPEKTPSTLTGKFLVKATVTSGGQSSEATANGTITVDQYFMLTLSSDAPYFETDKSGVSTTYRVLVTNKGNGPDTFAVQIDNQAVLRSSGWTVRLDREVTPVVQPGLLGEVTVTVNSPKDSPGFEARTAVVVVNATSVGARTQNTMISHILPLVFHQKAIDPIFDVTVPTIIAAVVVASVAVGIWRWRRKRKGRVLDVEEAPPE